MNKSTQPADPNNPFNDSTDNRSGNGDDPEFARAKGGSRIGRLALKELRETLRDRRTIITLIAMPLLVYPILSLVFRTFLFSSLAALPANEPLVFKIGVDSEIPHTQVNSLLNSIYSLTRDRFEGLDEQAPEESNPANHGAGSTDLDTNNLFGQELQFVDFFAHEWGKPLDADLDLLAIVEEGSVDVGWRIKSVEGGFRSELIYDPTNPRSQAAATYLSSRFNLFNMRDLLRKSNRNQPQIALSQVTISKPQQDPPASVSIAAIIPLMLVLMTITGAVYPAIDLTAGERERGTLETLVAAPIPRISILVSKFVAVLTVAVMTAALNIVGMMVTIWAFRLEEILAGPGGITLAMMVKIFALLVLFAGFFSALLLAVTSYARSFKEAQAYLIPIILLSLAPGLMALTPGLSLNGPLAVAPMVNILLLARDVLEGQVATIPAIIAVASTILYGGLAILIAAKIFGTDAILYGSQGSWTDLVTRPSESQPLVPLSLATSCLALLFPANFVLIGLLGRFEGGLNHRLLLMGLFTVFTFWAVPTLLAAFQKVEFKTGFGLKFPKPRFILVGLLLGLSLWPLVMSIISGWQVVLETFMGQAESQQWHDRLIEFGKSQADDLREVNPVIIGLTFALLPSVCEEWFFRGFLLRSLLSKRSPWIAISISAIVFGLFHVLSNSVVAMDRLLPTTLVGLVLGVLCYRSGSIVPGILLHMLHNGLIAFLAYYQPELSKLSWFPQVDASIPTSWIIASAIVSAIGITVLLLSRPDESPGALDGV